MRTEDNDRLLLTYLGASLVASGHPVNEVEAEIRGLGRARGYPELQVAATMNGITLTLASGRPATFESIEGTLRLDQAVAVNEVRLRLLAGDIDPEEALREFRELRGRAPRVPPGLRDLANVLIAGGLALILAPGWTSVLAAAVLGYVVALMARIAMPRQSLRTLLPPAAAFVVSLTVFSLFAAGAIADPLRAILPPIAVLLPGALLVTGMTELAAGQMFAGSGRLVLGSVQLMLYTMGVVAAASILRVPATALATPPFQQSLPLSLVGLVAITAGILVMESVPVRLLGWIALVVAATFAAQVVGQRMLGSAPWGGLLGGIVASAGASLIEILRPKLPRLVVFLPSFWLLVPGSLGLLGFAGLGLRGDSSATSLLLVLGTVSSISVGVLIGAAFANWVRGTLRRRRPADARP